MSSSTPIIELKGVSKRFSKKLDFAGKMLAKLGAPVKDETVHAVDGVDLTVTKGEVVGLVGESGCGKSTLGRMVAGIMPASDGTIRWHGKELAELTGADGRRAKLQTQMIFQDPMSSLNPRLRVADIVGEAPLVHGLTTRREFDGYVDEQLRRAGFDPSLKRRYPHQFSGGQRARIGIARALAVKPRMLVCDESVAALDVSIQAQVLNLFLELRRDLGLTYLFVSHDLGVIAHVASRVAVMYLGRLVEVAPAETLFCAPAHPYTISLLAQTPKLVPGKRRFQALPGEPPSPLAPPPGCPFHPRCPAAIAVCRTELPLRRSVGPEHEVACHRDRGELGTGDRTA